MKSAIAALVVLLSLLVDTAWSTNVFLGEEWLYRVRGKRLRIIGGDLYNNSSWTSGDLEISLWALRKKFNGRSQRGYKMGSVNVSPMRGKSYIPNFVRTTRYKKPPRGNWYRSIILCEWDEGGCYARSWRNWPTRKRYR